MVKFGERICELRLEKNLSQEQLANYIGVNRRSISNWEKGSRQPDFQTLEKLVNFFDVTADYLLGFKDY